MVKKAKKEGPAINDLIFKELIKRGYSLEGNTRIWNIADSKLWYLTPSQAQAYIDAIEDAPDYKAQMVDKEINLLKEKMEDIFKTLKMDQEEITIMDIGCGTGKKAIVPIEFLRKKKKKIKYCPIDISSHMVAQAKKNISELNVNKVVDFQWNISDFENLENVTPLLRKKGEGIFMLFLGSTLGNFEIHEVLYEIRESMGPHDFILIGVALANKEGEDYAEAYRTEQADLFLGKVLEQIGFSREEIEYNARYRNHRVECFYTIKKDKEILFHGRKVHFGKGDQIIVSVSYKYDQKHLEDALKLYFDHYQVFLNQEKDWALALCKK